LTEIRELLARHDAGHANGHAVEAGLSLRPEQVREQIALLERQQVEIAEALAELRASLKPQP
jgi:DNA-binding transcriptional MerR regulator